MRTGIHWALAAIGDRAVPVNHLAGGVGGLQLQPDVERIEGTTGEEVSDGAGAHDHIHAGSRTRHKLRLRYMSSGAET